MSSKALGFFSVSFFLLTLMSASMTMSAIGAPVRGRHDVFDGFEELGLVLALALELSYRGDAWRFLYGVQKFAFIVSSIKTKAFLRPVLAYTLLGLCGLDLLDLFRCIGRRCFTHRDWVPRRQMRKM